MTSIDGASLFREVLGRLGRGESLDEQLASEAMGLVMEGRATPAQVGGMLIGLRTKGETVDEIVGCARAIRARAAAFPASADGLVDTCGTGGDGSRTFNISTAAAIVAAGAGAMVAKHGNRAVSSSTGSADVLESLGVDIALGGAEAAEVLRSARVTFLFAPAFHAAMRHAAPVRRELGVRTVFNILGPLCNPAGATAQVIGVFDRSLVRPIADAAARLGIRRAMVVHGSDGLDELTVTAPTLVAEVNGESVAEFELDPMTLGIPRHARELLLGGDAAENAAILRAIFDPDAAISPALRARRDIVALNAGAALVVAGRAAALRDGVELARESIGSGRAARTLGRLVDACAELSERRRRRPVVEPVRPLAVGWGR